MKKIYYEIIFILLNIIFCSIEYNKAINEKCSVNLQCQSGCCRGDKCVETKKCKTYRNTIYVVVAIVGVVLAAVFTVYLMINLCKIKKEFDIKANGAKKATEEKEKKENEGKQKNN